ncbi:MAG: hypothetical protein Q8R25_04625 [bacterium]|nr:hypothetical protein [bacterium]
MDKSSGMKISGEASSPTPEQLNTLEVKRLTDAEFGKYEGQIRGLSRNALDTHEGKGLSEREREVTNLDEKYLEAAKRGELFIGVKNDVVIAFVALKKTSGESGKKAVIDQIRFAAGLHKPEEIVRTVLKYVTSSLEKEGIHQREVESDGEHHNLSGIEGSSWFKKTFNVEDSEEVSDDNLELRG